MIKIIVNKEKITSESLKNEILDSLKNCDKTCELFLDEEGDIAHEGYDYDSDSSGATYKSQDEYTKKAWLRFIKLDEDCIYFGLMKTKGGNLTKTVYAWYHTQFSNYLLNYFDEKILEINISSKLVKDIDIF